MKTPILISIITLLFVLPGTGQIQTYSLKKAPFSSDKEDDYSPVYYKKGLVFCTNRNANSFSTYYDSQHKGLFKIFYVDTTQITKKQNPELLSKNLKTNYNDGPVTFSSNYDTIYYSRNMIIEGNAGNLAKSKNKLGIFYAVYNGMDWTKVRELRINNERYNLTTPYYSSVDRKLFFASDKPGGYGDSDLYYSKWNGTYWGDPVNLGPIINTSGNEAYPFINQSGELYFSSDGHHGLGLKDIFYSRYSDSAWLSPIALAPPVNSKYDDFGIIYDSLMNEGYFSSNRDGTLDIFHFTTNFPQNFYSDIQKENQYCFNFDDNQEINIDTLKLKYVWDFGEGGVVSGISVNHCFAGSGNYVVKLNIIDKRSGKLFFSKLGYELEIKDIKQPYINSTNFALKGDSVNFDGLRSIIPGFRITNYSWDFGDGARSKGASVKHLFSKSGEFFVNLTLTLKSDTSDRVHRAGISKKITVYSDLQEKSSHQADRTDDRIEIRNIMNCPNVSVKQLYSSETDLKQDGLFEVEIVSAKTKLGTDNTIFRKIPGKYTIREVFDNAAGLYRYTIDQQLSLMETYNTFMEIQGYGFSKAIAIIKTPNDPAEKELNGLKKIFGIRTDMYFDNKNRLTSNAYLLLDQIVNLMNKYPGINLMVGVSAFNDELADNQMKLSQIYSTKLSDYLINKGVDGKRLIGRGMETNRPDSSTPNDKVRLSDNTLELMIIRN